MVAVVREEVQVPEKIEFKLEGNAIEISGPKGRLARAFEVPGVELRKKGKSIIIETKSKRRRKRAAIGMIKAHLLNMFKGVTEGFTYKLRIVYSHFPITVKIEGERVLIYNLLGERSPRVARIVGDVSVEVKGDEILVSGIDREKVGQTAFNIEQATFVRHRDLRVFQDGCFIVERG
jgi:large subunit ribosomal protein L6